MLIIGLIIFLCVFCKKPPSARSSAKKNDPEQANVEQNQNQIQLEQLDFGGSLDTQIKENKNKQEHSSRLPQLITSTETKKLKDKHVQNETKKTEDLFG